LTIKSTRREYFPAGIAFSGDGFAILLETDTGHLYIGGRPGTAAVIHPFRIHFWSIK